MIQSIKKIGVLCLLVTVFMSCNQGRTLQTYYVDNELKPGFLSFDVPSSFVNVEHVDLTEEQKEAYESVNKLNILAYKTDQTNVDDYTIELNKINTILKDEKYQELMRGGSPSDGKFVVKYLGDVDNIDELIIFGNANDKGFLIARVLGDDMNAGKLLSLRNVLDKVKFEDSQLGNLKNFFK